MLNPHQQILASPENIKIVEIILNGDETSVRKLIEEKGANYILDIAIREKDTNGVMKTVMTPYPIICLVAGYAKTEIVRMLLDAGANTEATTATGVTPLLMAATKHKVETMKLLIERNANVNAKTATGDTPLLIAIKYQEVVEMLLEKGASINAQDPIGNTALITATGLGLPAIVKLLLDAGADRNIKNKGGETALRLARDNDDQEIISLLHVATFQERLEKIGKEDSIPDDLKCPISRDLMDDPVTLTNGQTYDRSSLEYWYNSLGEPPPTSFRCPMTNTLIQATELKNGTNISLKNIIEKFVIKEEEKAKRTSDSKNKKHDLTPSENKAKRARNHNFDFGSSTTHTTTTRTTSANLDSINPNNSDRNEPRQ